VEPKTPYLSWSGPGFPTFKKETFDHVGTDMDTYRCSRRPQFRTIYIIGQRTYEEEENHGCKAEEETWNSGRCCHGELGDDRRRMNPRVPLYKVSLKKQIVIDLSPKYSVGT
jgi:hypothetical protein